MPPTEPCPKGAENAANINALKEAFGDFRDEARIDIADIRQSVTRLVNHYSQRPQWYWVLIVSTGVGVITTLATYIIMAK